MKANVQQIDALPEAGAARDTLARVQTHERFAALPVAAALTLALGIIDALLTFYLAGGGSMEAASGTASLVNQSALQSASIRWVLTAGVIVIAVTLGNVRLFGPVRLASVLHGIIIGYAGLILYALGLIIFS